MAAVVSVDKKKKLARKVDRNSHDGSTGMSALTKRHFDHVKRKMFAFVDQQQRMESGSIHLTPPPPFHHHPPPPPNFVDQNKALKQPSHHRTPAPVRKHFQPSIPPHQHLPPHIAFAIPQVPRRAGRPPVNINGRLSPNVAIF